MTSKTITFTDFNGETRTETYQFHLSRAELIKLSDTVPGGLATYIKQISAENDTKKLGVLFHDLIEMSVGVKSADGLRFVKNADIRDAFVQSDAYSELLMGFLNNPNEVAEFIKGVIPDSL